MIASVSDGIDDSFGGRGHPRYLCHVTASMFTSADDGIDDSDISVV